MEHQSKRREQLLWSIRWLAADPDKALSALDDPRVVPDEIALQLNHSLDVARGYGFVDDATLPLLVAIDEEFSSLSGEQNAEEWTPEAVAASPRWKAQREKARQALVKMGDSRADEDLRGHV